MCFDRDTEREAAVSCRLCMSRCLLCQQEQFLPQRSGDPTTSSLINNRILSTELSGKELGHSLPNHLTITLGPCIYLFICAFTVDDESSIYVFVNLYIFSSDFSSFFYFSTSLFKVVWCKFDKDILPHLIK